MSLEASNTIMSKSLYEQEAEQSGVKIFAYRKDNGVYKSKAFKNDLELRGQTMSFSGVGVYQQNGVAGRSIPTVVNSTRTMMLHQAFLWPKNFHVRLWPFALTHAAYLWNILSNGLNGLTSTEIFTGTKMDNKTLRSGKT